MLYFLCHFPCPCYNLSVCFRLKENILRFGCVMRPLTECLAVVTSLLHWESTSATLLALVVYLYSVLFGWVLTLILTLAIIRLSINYLKKR